MIIIDDFKKLARWVVWLINQCMIIDHKFVVTILWTVSWISFKLSLE